MGTFGGYTKKAYSRLSRLFPSTPGWARTSNLRFRRPVLYPIELQVHTENTAVFRIHVRSHPKRREKRENSPRATNEVSPSANATPEPYKVFTQFAHLNRVWSRKIQGKLPWFADLGTCARIWEVLSDLFYHSRPPKHVQFQIMRLRFWAIFAEHPC